MKALTATARGRHPLGARTTVIALGLAAACLNSPTARAADYIYEVKPGDSLEIIADRFLEPPHDWRSLQSVNRFARPSVIQPGQTVQIPRAWMKLDRVRAEIVSASGSTRMNGQPVSVGTSIGESQTLQTDQEGTLVLRLPDGSEIRIPPASRVRIERLRRYFGSKALDARFLLERGRLEAAVGRRGRHAVQSPEEPSPRLEIRTPKATAAVRGTVFRVGESTTRSVSEVVAGAVQWRGKSNAADLRMGFGSSAGLDGRVTPPEPLLPAPRTKHSPARFSSAEVTVALEPVEGATAYRASVARDARFERIVTDQVYQSPVIRFTSRADGPHFLKVRAISPRGIEGHDLVAQIDVDARPRPPSLEAPGSAAAVVPGEIMFGWRPSPDAAGGYRIQIAADPGFERVLTEADTDSTAFRHEPTPSDASRLVYWRVAALSPKRLGPYSAPRTLTLRPSPPTARVTVEGNDATVSWPARTAARYVVRLQPRGGPESATRQQVVGQPGLRLSGLVPGDYLLSVATRYDDGQTTGFGSPVAFSVATPIVDRFGAPVRAGHEAVLIRTP